MDAKNIIIKGSQLSFNDYKEFYSCIPKLLDAAGKLTITINSTDFQEFDLGLIAYILLMKNQQPMLQTAIETGSGVTLNTAIANRLVSYKYYSEAIIGKPVFDEDRCKKEETRKTKINLHSSFVPIIPVSGSRELNNIPINSYNTLFREPWTKLKPKSRFVEVYHPLINEAFWRILNDAFLDVQYTKANPEHVRESHQRHSYGKLKEQITIPYYEGMASTVAELKQKPGVFIFLFYLILRNSELPTPPKKSGSGEKVHIQNQRKFLEEIQEIFTNAYSFSQDLFRGIDELAKNIEEHSSTGFGIVNLRAYPRNYAADNSGSAPATKWASFRKNKEVLCVVDVTVADLGDKGVIPTLLEATQKLSVNPPDLLADDIGRLKKGEFKLCNLLNVQSGLILNHQAKRSIAHLGLLTLMALVKNNDGITIASSMNGSVRDTYCDDELSHLDTLPITGTSYNIRFPFIKGKPRKPFLSIKMDPPVEIKLEDIKAFDELQLFLEKDALINISLTQPTASGRKQEARLIQEINKGLLSNTIGKIVAVDFSSLSDGDHLAAHQLFRIAAHCELIGPGQHFVLYNLKNEWIEALAEANDIYFKTLLQTTNGESNLDYWNSNKVTLTISYRQDAETNRRFYFTDAFWGKDKIQCQTLNQLISKGHFNSLCWQKDKAPLKDLHMPNFDRHPAFINQHVLLPLDLLLEYKGMTLFEFNASFLIQNEVTPTSKEPTGSNNILDVIKSRPGYKIGNTHFAIGNKIHASSFYYAKRIFQNSFYAYRFAFLVARRILNILEPNPKKIISLIGYGIYSDLMVSQVQKILNKHHNGLVDKYNLIDTRSKGKLVHPDLVPGAHSFFIVPIASTLSTGFKIEQTLSYARKEIGDNELSQPTYLNILLACDSRNVDTIEELKKTQLLWENENTEARTVTVCHSNTGATSTQHYFIKVPTEWHIPETCELCFPLNEGNRGAIKRERALFSADPTEVNPDLVFGLPQAKKISRPPDAYIKRNHIQYGHHERNAKHFLFAVDTVQFLVDNEKDIRKWLFSLNAENQLASAEDRVVLVAECHHTNVRFVNLVNEVVFLSTATVLHFDSDSDFVDNFTLVYREEINDATKIYFVDDSLKSGNTFSKIHFCVYNTLNKISRGDSYQIIDGAILLLNKMQPRDEHWISQRLRKHTKCAEGSSHDDAIQAFVDLNIYTSIDYNKTSPLELEEGRYCGLIRRANLDRLKNHYMKERDKVSAKTNPGESEDKSEPNTPRDHLFFATHGIYTRLAALSHDTASFDSEFLEQLSELPRTSPDAVLKVLSHPPLSQYKPIRERVLEKVTALLYKFLYRYSNEELEKGITPEYIRYVKYYIRRACILDSNALFHPETLDRVFEIVKHSIVDRQENGRSASGDEKPAKEEQDPIQTELVFKVEESRTNPIKQQSMEEFCYFFGAQIVESADRHVFRGVVLEKYMKQELSSYDDLEPRQKKLLRLLYLENGQIIEDSWDRIKCYGAPKDAYAKNSFDHSIETLPDHIGKRKEITNSRQFRQLGGFCGDGLPLQCQRYKAWLWIRSVIDSDNYMRSVSLSDKTEGIMKTMCSLFATCEATDSNWSSFFAVYPPDGNKTNSEMPFIVHDHRHGSAQMYWNQLEPAQVKAINELTNINEEDKTIFAYKKARSARWVDVLKLKYSEIPEDQAKAFDFLRDDFDLFLVIYIRKTADGFPQGVLGFYHSSGSGENDAVKSETWLEAVRYILLLRKPLSIFIANHHENQEFIAWEKARDAQLIYKLSGHGRDSIENFVQGLDNAEDDFNEMPRNMEEVQHILMRNRGRGTKYSATRKSELVDLFDPVNSINLEDIMNRYKNLTQLIIDSEYLETGATGIKLKNDMLTQHTDKTFCFYYKLLDLILFELLLNAKKNRWISFEDGFTNTISLAFEINSAERDNSLEITIKNTSPRISSEMLGALNIENSSLKPRGDESSGIALCRYLLGEICRKNTVHLNYSCDKKVKGNECDVYETVAILTLHSLNTEV